MYFNGTCGRAAKVSEWTVGDCSCIIRESIDKGMADCFVLVLIAVSG